MSNIQILFDSTVGISDLYHLFNCCNKSISLLKIFNFHLILILFHLSFIRSANFPTEVASSTLFLDYFIIRHPLLMVSYLGKLT